MCVTQTPPWTKKFPRWEPPVGKGQLHHSRRYRHEWHVVNRSLNFAPGTAARGYAGVLSGRLESKGMCWTAKVPVKSSEWVKKEREIERERDKLEQTSPFPKFWDGYSSPTTAVNDDCRTCFCFLVWCHRQWIKRAQEWDFPSESEIKNWKSISANNRRTIK